MAKPKPKAVPISQPGLTPADIARLMQGDIRTLGAEFRLKLAETLPADDRGEPATPSVPLPELEQRFFQWLDDSVRGAKPARIKAFNLCLYEGIDFFEADFFGCPSYSKTDPDWACEWCHEGKGRFVLASNDIEPEWEVGLRVAKKLFKKYLASDRPGAAVIHKVGTATIGFSDGDLNLVLAAKKGRA